jgi:hypothetical protein
VSVDVGGLVLGWELGDGRVSYRFRLAGAADDGREVDVSCAALDAGQREVLVGHANGRVLAHNFNSGTLAARYLCGSASPVVTLRVAEPPQGERRSGHGGGAIFAATLDGCVWMWVAAAAHRAGGRVPFEKRFRLPPERPDFDMDVSAMAHHRSGLLATGRQDGRVLVWNTVDGRLKRDLVDDLFVRMDIDGSGSLSRAEAAEFLRERGHSQEAADDFFRRADRDGSGEISKEEFRAALARMGSLAIDPLTGGRLARREQQVELVRFVDGPGGELVVVAVSADGSASVFGAETGALLRTLTLPHGKRADALTCFAVDDAEGLLFAGDCVGMLKAYDVNQLAAAGRSVAARVVLLQAWKAHYEAVNTLAAVAASLLLVSCNGGPEPRILVWTYGGELVGVAGDRYNRMWAVPAEPDRGLTSRLRIAATLAAVEAEREAEDGRRSEQRLSAVPSAAAAAAAQRRRRMERRMSTMQNAAFTVVNKRFLDRAVARRAELEVRQKRMRLFFRLHRSHFAGSPGLIESFEAHMEQFWQAEIEERERAQAEQRAAAAAAAAVGGGEVGKGRAGVELADAPPALVPAPSAVRRTPSDGGIARILPPPPVPASAAEAGVEAEARSAAVLPQLVPRGELAAQALTPRPPPPCLGCTPPAPLPPLHTHFDSHSFSPFPVALPLSPLTSTQLTACPCSHR